MPKIAVGTKVVAVKDGLGVREGFKFSQSAYWDYTVGTKGTITEVRKVGTSLVPTFVTDSGKVYYSCDFDEFMSLE